LGSVISVCLVQRQTRCYPTRFVPGKQLVEVSRQHAYLPGFVLAENACYALHVTTRIQTHHFVAALDGRLCADSHPAVSVGVTGLRCAVRSNVVARFGFADALTAANRQHVLSLSREHTAV